MIKYQITEELRTLSEQESYLAYGIECIEEREESFIRLIAVADVSTEKALVGNLVEKLNRGNLSPIHLLDVIEDELP